MKKLMIAAAIVCAAAFAQAASYNWKSASTLYTWDSAEEAGWPVMEGAQAYFVFADAYAQSALVNDFAAGTIDYDKLDATGGMTTVDADGLIGLTSASSDYTTAMPAYFVAIQGDTMFISDVVEAAYDELTAKTVTFEADQVEAFWTGETPYDAAAGYVGAGYYAVPEPTTGLLMLLGMGALALRRRRA